VLLAPPFDISWDARPNILCSSDLNEEMPTRVSANFYGIDAWLGGLPQEFNRVIMLGFGKWFSLWHRTRLYHRVYYGEISLAAPALRKNYRDFEIDFL
jgi:hypothetical protein